MESSIITTGKTIDLAIQAALEQLHMDRDSVSVEVLEQAKSGFFGIGASPAKVKVTFEVADPEPEAPKPALSSASRSKKKPAAPKVESPKPAPQKPEPKVEAPKPAPKKEEPKAETPKAPRPERKPAPKPQPRKEVREDVEQATPVEPKTYAPATEGSVEEKIEQFLAGLMEHMGSAAVPHAWKDGDVYKVDLVGDKLGMLIGRRGETLDAIQHLTNYAINHCTEGHVRINVDAEAYRQKREDSLRRYARKKAQQVLKVRRRTTLEPMNAYERHVIHASLQDMDNITTHSTGVEPNRRVVIEYVR